MERIKQTGLVLTNDWNTASKILSKESAKESSVSFPDLNSITSNTQKNLRRVKKTLEESQ